jgi:hypothetical protein
MMLILLRPQMAESDLAHGDTSGIRTTLRPRSVADKAAVAAALRDKVWPLIEVGATGPSRSPRASSRTG